MEIPTIDLAGIDEGASRQAIARELALHSRTTGWALLKNHKIPRTEVDQIFEVASTLLNAPSNKQKGWQVDDDRVGYDGDPEASVHSVYLSGKPGMLAENAESLPLSWQPHVDRIESFKEACQQLILKLLGCFDLAMRLQDERSLVEKHKDNPESAVYFRVRKIMPETSTPEKDSPLARVQTADVTGTGTIAIVFHSGQGCGIDVEVDGQWRTMPTDRAQNLVLAWM